MEQRIIELEIQLKEKDGEIANWKYQYKRASQEATNSAKNEKKFKEELQRWQKASDWLKNDWGTVESTFGCQEVFGESKVEVTCFRLESGQGENRSFTADNMLDAIELAMIAPSFTGEFLEEWEQQKEGKEHVTRKLRFLLERLLETLTQDETGKYYISAKDLDLITVAFNFIKRK